MFQPSGTDMSVLEFVKPYPLDQSHTGFHQWQVFLQQRQAVAAFHSRPLLHGLEIRTTDFGLKTSFPPCPDRVSLHCAHPVLRAPCQGAWRCQP